MSDDPRSYRVPVLRITDVSRDSGLNDENVQDDSFDFKAPNSAPQPGTAPAPTMALPSEPAVPVAAYIAPAPKEEIPVEVPGYMVPPVPVRPAPETLSASNSPRTPLPKVVDPFEKQRAPDPLDIWEQAALKKSTPPPTPMPPRPAPAPLPQGEPVAIPEPAPAPQAQKIEAVVTPQPVSIPQPQVEPEPIITPEPVSPQPQQVGPAPIVTPKPVPIPAPVMEKEVTPVVNAVPNTPPASPYTYGTPPVQKTEEAILEKPVEIPPEPVFEPATGAKTEALLNQALAGMGFANIPEEKPAPTLPVPKPTPVPQPPVDVQVGTVEVKKDVPLPPRVEPIPAPPTADDTLTPPAKTPTSNLTALRERVLHAGEHKEAGIEQKHIVIQTEKQTVPVPAPAPEAQELTRTFSAPPPPAPSEKKPVSDAVPPVKRDLETTHARAIADVAEALHAIQQSDMEQPAPPPPQAPMPEAYVPTAEGAPFVVQPAPAPPTNEGVSTPRRTGIPMMRTFKSDVEKTINRDRVSVVKMISDQEVRRHDSPDVTVRKTKRQHFTIASPILLTLTLLLAVGAIAIGVFISVVVLRPNVTDTVNTLFFANESVEHDATGQDRTALLQSLTRIRDSVSLPLGQVMEVVLIEHIVLNDVDTGQTRSVTGKEFLERVNARAPGTLVRTVLDSFIIGVHAQARQEPFIVLRAGYHENAFSGMLLWEETMDADLSPFFGPPVVRGEESVPQTTESGELNPSTVDTRDLGTFDDATIANTATRVLRDAGGTIRMVWAMPDTSTIIITTNPQTFEEIKNRMQAR